MYKIIGSDGKEYGPIGADLVTQWIRDRRAGGTTKVQAEGSTEWKTLSQLPEFAGALAAQAAPSRPPANAGGGASSVPLHRDRSQGLAITSMVLGILGFCSGFLTGIPAIICGHIAHGKARRSPETHGGTGFAIAGFVLGYLSLFLGTAVLAGMLLPAFAKAKSRAQSINCVNHMKQIGLAARMWANDHNSMFPEDFASMSNELVSTKILVCPATGELPASNWEALTPDHLGYEIVAPGIVESSATASEIAFRCEYHGHIGLVDGSVQQKQGRW